MLLRCTLSCVPTFNSMGDDSTSKPGFSLHDLSPHTEVWCSCNRTKGENLRPNGCPNAQIRENLGYMRYRASTSRTPFSLPASLPFCLSYFSISVPTESCHPYIIQIDLMQRCISAAKVKLQRAAPRGRRLKLPPCGRPVEAIPRVRYHRHSDVSLRS